MENTINLKKPNGYEMTHEVDMSALNNLIAKTKTDFISRLCRYDCDEILHSNMGERYKGLPVLLKAQCSHVGELPAFTCEQDKLAHVQRVQRAIEDSRNSMKQVYNVA